MGTFLSIALFCDSSVKAVSHYSSSSGSLWHEYSFIRWEMTAAESYASECADWGEGFVRSASGFFFPFFGRPPT
jgi:hypothetical protein